PAGAACVSRRDGALVRRLLSPARTVPPLPHPGGYALGRCTRRRGLGSRDAAPVRGLGACKGRIRARGSAALRAVRAPAPAGLIPFGDHGDPRRSARLTTRA